MSPSIQQKHKQIYKREGNPNSQNDAKKSKIYNKTLYSLAPNRKHHTRTHPHQHPHTHTHTYIYIYRFRWEVGIRLRIIQKGTFYNSNVKIL